MHSDDGPDASKEPQETSPAEMFRLFLFRARRSALRHWLLQGFVQAMVWNAFPFIAFVCLQHAWGPKLETLLGAFAASGVATCVALWWWRRGVVLNFAEKLDERCQAEGRIASAAEFVRQGDCDAYEQIAISEAGRWLSSRPNRCLDWHWPWEAYAIVPIGVVVFLVCRYV